VVTHISKPRYYNHGYIVGVGSENERVHSTFIMTIRRAYIVVFICVIITTQSTSAGSHGAGVICGQQRCAKYVEYCDPLIEICTSCVLACSRTTIADSNLCKRLCPGMSAEQTLVTFRCHEFGTKL